MCFGHRTHWRRALDEILDQGGHTFIPFETPLFKSWPEVPLVQYTMPTWDAQESEMKYCFWAFWLYRKWRGTNLSFKFKLECLVSKCLLNFSFFIVSAVIHIKQLFWLQTKYLTSFYQVTDGLSPKYLAVWLEALYFNWWHFTITS